MIGNKILKFSRIYTIVATVILGITGIVLIIVGLSHQETVKSGWYENKQAAPIVGLIIAGVVCCLYIPLIWIRKLFIDGFGLIVLSSENSLKKDGVKTYIDKLREKTATGREKYYFEKNKDNTEW